MIALDLSLTKVKGKRPQPNFTPSPRSLMLLELFLFKYNITPTGEINKNNSLAYPKVELDFESSVNTVNDTLSFQHLGQDDTRPSQDMRGQANDTISHSSDNSNNEELPDLMEIDDSLTLESEVENDLYDSDSDSDSVVDEIDDFDLLDPNDDLTEHAPRCTACLLYTSPSPRDKRQSRMPSSA